MKTKDSLRGLTAWDLMSPEVLSVRSRSSMREAAQLLATAALDPSTWA